MPSPVKAEALVLKTFDFGETSLIACLYTKEYGKISGILKGIRGDSQKFASSLEPFSHNEIIFYKKKNTSIHLVSQCDLKDNFDFIRRDAAKVGSASVMMELLDAVSPPEEANADTFNLAVDCLKAMADGFLTEKISTIFKIKLLDLCGFKPHFDSCLGCGGRIIGEGKFSVGLGGLICPNCYKKDPRARTMFRGTIATILHIEKNDIPANLRLGINPQIKRELDVALSSFLDFHIDKKLKSQNVLDALKLAQEAG